MGIEGIDMATARRPSEFPVATTPAPGVMGVDWEQRVDYDRLRRYRLDRARRALEESELGALLVFDTANIRYLTATHIGYWAFNKMERWALLTVPLWLGTAAAAAGTLAGLALVWLAYYASEPWNAVSLLAGAGVLQLSTHGPAHLAAGRLAGIRFTHWFVGSLKQIQPGVKTDYASYLAATPKGRAWMHASGAVMTKIVPFALIPAGLVAGVPSWAVILLAASGALSIFTDIVWSTRVSDWKKFRREMKAAATAR